jgi:hypothetical protein
MGFAAPGTGLVAFEVATGSLAIQGREGAIGMRAHDRNSPQGERLRVLRGHFKPSTFQAE